MNVWMSEYMKTFEKGFLRGLGQLWFIQGAEGLRDRLLSPQLLHSPQPLDQQVWIPRNDRQEDKFRTENLPGAILGQRAIIKITTTVITGVVTINNILKHDCHVPSTKLSSSHESFQPSVATLQRKGIIISFTHSSKLWLSNELD